MNNLSSKGYYSDSTFDKYISLDPYLNLYYNCIEKEKVLTNTEICFSPTIKFGSTIEFVKKNNPHEYTILQNTNDCVILLYKIKYLNSHIYHYTPPNTHTKVKNQ